MKIVFHSKLITAKVPRLMMVNKAGDWGMSKTGEVMNAKSKIQTREETLKRKPYLTAFSVQRLSNGFVMTERWFGKEDVMSIAVNAETVLGRLSDII